MSDDSVLSAQSPLTLAENVNDIPQKLLGGSTYRESSLLTIIDYKNNGELKTRYHKYSLIPAIKYLKMRTIPTEPATRLT